MADNADGRIVIETEIDDSGIERGSDKMRSCIEGLEQSVENLGKNAESALAGINNGMAETAAAGEQAGEGIGRAQAGALLLLVAVHGLGEKLGSAATKALSLAKAVIKIPLKAIAAAASKAKTALGAFGRQADSTRTAAQFLTRSLLSLKTMLITSIKSTFISDITKSMKDGIQQFALYSEGFNRAMSNIKNTGSQIGGQVAALMANIITVVEPVLTRILSLINSVIVAVSALFAMFSGKSTVSVASKQTTSYADSLKDAAGSASKAAKEQKKLNAELYGWDELTRQSKKEDTDTSGAGGGVSGPSWDEVPIDSILPQKIRDWIDKIKEAFKKGDWYGIGEIIAEGLNAAMKKVDDWINNTLRPLGVLWAGRIAEILNGLTDKLDWKLLGKTIADGFNAAFDIVNTFLEKYNFKNLGKGLGKAIKSWFDTIEWDLVGKTFANKWNALIHTIEGIVTTPGIWTSIGGGIGKAVKSWFATIDFDSLATDFIASINGVFETVRAFLAENPFEGAADKISSALNRMIHEIDWAGNAQTLSNFIIALLDVILDVVEKTDWHAVGEAIGTFLANIDWAGILSRVGEIIFEVASGVISGLLSTHGGRIFILLVAALKALPLAFALTQVVWALAVQRWIYSGISPLESMSGMISGIVPGIKAALGKIASAFTAAAPVIATAALGVADAILIAYDTKALVDASNTYHEAQNAHNNETETALNNFKQLYETKGPEVAAEWAKTCYQIDTTGMSLDQAQSELAAKVDSYWDDVPQNMWDGFKQGWDAYFGADGAGLLALLGDAFTGAINGIKALLGIASPSTVFAAIGTDMVSGLFNGISQAWSSITTFFSTVLSSLKTSITSSWNSIKTTTSTTYNSIRTTIQTNFNTARTAVTTAVNTMKQNAVSGWQNMLTNAKTKFQEIYNTCKSKMDSVTSHLRGIQWGSIGSNLVNGLLNGLRSAWSSVMSWASSAAQSLTNTLRSAFSIHSPSKEWAQIGVFLDEGLEQGLENGQRSMLATASELAENLTDRMTDVNSTMQLTNDGDIERLNVISGKLSGIAAIIDRISEALASMGGLTIPQVASGAVIPYQVKAAAMSGGGSNDTSGDAYTAEAVQLLRNIRDYLAGGGNRQNSDNIKIIIDGREVFNAVVNENNRIVKSTGGYSPLVGV